MTEKTAMRVEYTPGGKPGTTFSLIDDTGKILATSDRRRELVEEAEGLVENGKKAGPKRASRRKSNKK